MDIVISPANEHIIGCLSNTLISTAQIITLLFSAFDRCYTEPYGLEIQLDG